MLLSRAAFREAVLLRSDGRCVVCRLPAQDAHHLMERRLWPDGGYYLDNGVALCATCHLQAEATLLSCEELRSAAGIAQVVLPPHLYDDEVYTKWGDIILPSGQRVRGELFEDESVQAVLRPVLHRYTTRVKHPRTYHFPWSPGVGKDDRVLDDLSGLDGEEVVVTVKMDGEQTTFYTDGLHARSLEDSRHSSRTWVRQLHAQIAHDIPPGWRVCGENLYAQHSIAYTNLSSYFQVFGIWNGNNRCLSWDTTLEWAALFGLHVVPQIYRGPFSRSAVEGLYREVHDGDPCEGYVVRVAREFGYREFRRVVGKYVRAGHVQTHGRWMRQQIVQNGLRANAPAWR